MKAFIALLFLVVVAIQMAKAKSLDSHEKAEAEEIALKLSELKHDVELLEQRLSDSSHEEDVKPVNKPAHRGKEINKKFLGDILNWIGKTVIG
uniref:Uncharacterized protein n=1 Tax=Panagrolaimus davidi TaxID=227884 RepID=A0A914P6C7_9BILA